MRRFALVLSAFVMLAFAGAIAALADSVGPITFEPPTYTVGDINGQNGWMKLNPLFDVKVAKVADFPAAAGYGFGLQALRASDAYTSGTFGDQTFSPGLSQPAGEPPAQTHFEGRFRIGTTQATVQPGLHMSVSPDDGNGSRMSYLRFEDMPDGVHVFFDDVTDPGPFPTVATFNETDIATLDRAHAHSIRFSIDFKTGPANDVVKIYIDGNLKITGTTWEDYYRYDPEQIGNGNMVPTVKKLLFRESGAPDPGNLGQGFLVDGVYLASSTPVGNCGRNDESDQAERQALDHMNQQRSAAFLPALTMNTASSDAARKHSCDMHEHGNKGEQGSDGSMSADRMRAAGVPFLVNAENNGLATDLAATNALTSIEGDLLTGASSKANILNPAFTQVGIGAVYLDGEMYLTEDFTG
ncbi:MAG: CAP domain-containing protein [Gaiellaceae bacterium]